MIHSANFGDKALFPLELLNKVKSLKLDALFPNVVVILRVFLTLHVTVARAEWPFSALTRVKKRVEIDRLISTLVNIIVFNFVFNPLELYL